MTTGDLMKSGYTEGDVSTFFREQFQLQDMELRSNDLYSLAIYNTFLDWLKPYSYLRILDVACGVGELSHLLARHHHEVKGIDINKQFIEMAQKRAKELELTKCFFEVSSLEDYKHREQFDVVIGRGILEHIPDDRKGLEKMVSMLKPEGLIILDVPEGQWLFGYHDEMWQHYRRYSPRSLRNLLNNYIQLIELRHMGFFLIPICILYSKILRKNYPISKVGLNPLLSNLFSWIMKLESSVRFPVGVSLLTIGKVKSRA